MLLDEFQDLVVVQVAYLSQPTQKEKAVDWSELACHEADYPERPQFSEQKNFIFIFFQNT